MSLSEIIFNLLLVCYSVLGLTIAYVITDLAVNWRVLKTIRRNMSGLPYAVPQHKIGWDTGEYRAVWEHGLGVLMYSHDHVRLIEYDRDTNLKLYFHSGWLLKRLLVARLRSKLAAMARRDAEEFEHILQKHEEYKKLREFYESSRVRNKPKIKKAHL